jgi:hypothetical protein
MPTEQRAVGGFHSVRMEDFGILQIRQEPEETLTVETDADTLGRVHTTVRDGVLILRLGRNWMERVGFGLHASLTRPRVRYTLTVKELQQLTVAGLGRVEVGQLTAKHFAIQLFGAGDITIDALSTQCLEVELSGSGMVQVAGKVGQQAVSIRGAGSYEARKLESRRACVEVSGVGSATVWAVDDLDIEIQGLGSVEHRGEPEVHKRVHGPAGMAIPRPPVFPRSSTR